MNNRDKTMIYKVPDGVLTFSRLCLNENQFPDFCKSSKRPQRPIIRYNGTIEDCIGATQVIEANLF